MKWSGIPPFVQRLVFVTTSVLFFVGPMRLWADDPPPTPEDLERLAAIEAFTKKQIEADYPTKFKLAAEEFGVPVEILMSISFAETRYEHLTWPEGEKLSPENGMPRPYGIMSLWDNEVFGHSLLEAAKLIGKTPQELMNDPLQNMRGGAALLKQVYVGNSFSITNIYFFPSNTNRWRTNFFSALINDTHGILWQHDDGRVAFWGMDQTNFLGAMALPSDVPSFNAHWRVLGMSDFDHDGQAELLLRFPFGPSGRLAIGHIRDNRLVRMEYLDTLVPVSWKLLSIFNYYQKTILWDAGQTVMAWSLNGTKFTGQRAISWHSLPPAAMGNFNNDGYMDVLWQRNGSVGIDFLGLGTVDFTRVTAGRSQAYLNDRKPVVAGWTIVAVIDFNDDGHSDILWKNDDGRLGVWLMNGTKRVGAMLLRNGQPASPGWKVVGIK